MTISRWNIGVAARAVGLALIVGFSVFGFGVAHADNTDALIKQLDSDSDNVRRAATINLAKQSDARIILPFIKLLGNDSDTQVRSAAALGLGKLVNASTKPVLRDLTVKTLTIAAKDDSSSEVKKQAAASLALITGKATSTDPTNPSTTSGGGGGKGGVYVNVGPMSSKTGNTDDAKLRDMMVRAASKTITKEPTMSITWTGGAPTRKDLDKKGIQGFYVDGTLNELKTKENGASATISCKVSMLLASFPEKSVFGFLNGGASVSASASSESDKALARQDCVEAVVGDLIAKKIIPTIKSKLP